MKTRPSSLNSVLEEISDISSLVYQKGWAERNAGNLSVDITDIIAKRPPTVGRISHLLEKRFTHLKNRYFLFTKSGSKFRDIAKNLKAGLIFIKINSDGDGYFSSAKEENDRPTSEIISHLVIQNHLRKIKSAATVILHTHPTELITLSHIRECQSSIKLNRLLISVHPEVDINLPNKIGFVPYLPTGSEQLANATLAEVKNGKTVIIWERHGALAIDSDITTAFDNLEIVNKAALILLQLFTAGRVPHFVSNNM